MNKYISFVGTFDVPKIASELYSKFPMKYYQINEGENSHGEETITDMPEGFLEGLEYESVHSELDGIDLYLAKVPLPNLEIVGHLVVWCVAGGWNVETFCFIKDGLPVKSENNFNPNPVPQAC